MVPARSRRLPLARACLVRIVGLKDSKLKWGSTPLNFLEGSLPSGACFPVSSFWDPPLRSFPPASSCFFVFLPFGFFLSPPVASPDRLAGFDVRCNRRRTRSAPTAVADIPTTPAGDYHVANRLSAAVANVHDTPEFSERVIYLLKCKVRIFRASLFSYSSK